MVPALPSVKDVVDVVLYKSPELPLVPLVPEVPAVPLVPGVYPRMLMISAAVIGEAAVTNPFALTANLRGVTEGKIFGFTFCRRRLIDDPVNPDPTTSPVNVMGCGGITIGVGVILVTSPLLLTVTIGMVEPLPNVPGAKFTCANVRVPTPGPLAVPSPARPVR